MVEPDAEATLFVIESTLSIFKSFVSARIDPSATHSFVYVKFAKCLLVTPISLDKTIVTDTLVRDLLVYNLVYKFCRVKKAGRELPVDLLVLDF